MKALYVDVSMDELKVVEGITGSVDGILRTLSEGEGNLGVVLGKMKDASEGGVGEGGTRPLKVPTVDSEGADGAVPIGPCSCCKFESVSIDDLPCDECVGFNEFVAKGPDKPDAPEVDEGP